MRAEPMEPTDEIASPPRREWAWHPATAWAMLAVALPLGGWLLLQIHRTIGLGSPRLWELLRTDRVFDVAMLDFGLTAGWASLVLFERTRARDWRFWASIGVFCVAPSLGIALFVLLVRREPGRLSAR